MRRTSSLPFPSLAMGDDRRHNDCRPLSRICSSCLRCGLCGMLPHLLADFPEDFAADDERAAHAFRCVNQGQTCMGHGDADAAAPRAGNAAADAAAAGAGNATAEAAAARELGGRWLPWLPRLYVDYTADQVAAAHWSEQCDLFIRVWVAGRVLHSLHLSHDAGVSLSELKAHFRDIPRGPWLDGEGLKWGRDREILLRGSHDIFVLQGARGMSIQARRTIIKAWQIRQGIQARRTIIQAWQIRQGTLERLSETLVDDYVSSDSATLERPARRRRTD